MNYFYKKRLNKFKFIRRRKYNEKIIADYRRYCYRKIHFCKHSFKKISYKYIFKDSIKEVLGDTIGFSNREENKKLSSASMELMFFIFSEFASLEKDLILDSNFHKSEFVESFPELSLFFKAYSPLDSEMICIFPYFCPYAESAREIREIFS